MITTDTDLTNLVSDLAQKQILIESAKARVQATVEAAKLAYDEATRDLATEIQTGFDLINQYCTAHKDRLFPVKKDKRQKTLQILQILQHKLQYRSASEVTAPEDIIKRITARLQDLSLELRSLHPEDFDRIEAEIDLLNTLLRQPPLELNKDAASAALTTETTALQLAPLGITKTTTETFKLTFTLTPEA
jgi:hypothetical protein